MKIWPLLLLLGGCASTPIEDMYVELAVCVNGKGDCEELQEKINKREKSAAQRRYDRAIRCPQGTFEHCDTRRDRGCGRIHKSPDDQFDCVSNSQLGDIFRW